MTVAPMAGRSSANAAMALASVLLLATAAYAVDVWTKTWAEQWLELYQPVPILSDWLRLTLGYNTGVAFGMFVGGGMAILVVSGAIVLGVVAWVAVAARYGTLTWRLWSLGLILGGAVANLVDRLPDGRVTDFLDVGIGMARWPTFNFADSFIVLGTSLLILVSLRSSPTEPEGGR